MLCHFLPSSMVSDENFCQIIFLWQGVFSLFIFQYFSFSFRSLTVMCLCVDFFSFILFGVHSSSQICRISSLAKFGKFLHNFFEYFFQLCPFSTFLRLQRHTGKSFVILPQIPEALFREGIFFFPLCYSEFGNFYCSTFQFTDSFLCFFHSTDELIHAALISAIVLTVLKFPFGSSLYFLFFFWLRLYFSFVSSVFVFVHWNIFVMVTLNLY